MGLLPMMDDDAPRNCFPHGKKRIHAQKSVPVSAADGVSCKTVGGRSTTVYGPLR